MISIPAINNAVALEIIKLDKDNVELTAIFSNGEKTTASVNLKKLRQALKGTDDVPFDGNLKSVAHWNPGNAHFYFEASPKGFDLLVARIEDILEALTELYPKRFFAW